MRHSSSRRRAIGRLFALGLLAFIVLGGLLVTGLWLSGLGILFAVPTDSMAPAVAAGDHVYVEGVTFKVRGPRRGDLIAFRAVETEQGPKGSVYVKRLAGQPGDRVRITDGKVFINDEHWSLSNAAGEIRYGNIRSAMFLRIGSESVRVPPGNFFVLGDNTWNSSDSRFWGFLPVENVTGRVTFCYWPPSRIGYIK